MSKKLQMRGEMDATCLTATINTKDAKVVECSEEINRVNYEFEDHKLYVDGKYYGYIISADEESKTISVKYDGDNPYMKDQVIKIHFI